ncbi:MAG: ABC transporter substrate-binding protein [Bacteroidetes bacterium]|nr:MAG: ABC transporter substrate-binding protein [Bacteroidota bacterium]
MRKIGLAAVKYLNTLPMLHGLKHSPHSGRFDLHLEDPAECARMLLEGEVDIALCPVGALIDIAGYHIVSQYGIACKGPVRTVSIYSDQPLEELKVVRLYSESRSSNLLARILDQKLWKLGLQFIGPDDDGPDLPTGHLVIGDACFDRETEFQHITDLGDAWMKLTGLPFLFACWVSIKPVDDDIRDILDNAFSFGIADLENLDLPQSQIHVDLHHYLKHHIRYRIDAKTLDGMTKFINYVGDLDVSSHNATQTPFGQSV